LHFFLFIDHPNLSQNPNLFKKLQKRIQDLDLGLLKKGNNNWRQAKFSYRLRNKI